MFCQLSGKKWKNNSIPYRNTFGFFTTTILRSWVQSEMIVVYLVGQNDVIFKAFVSSAITFSSSRIACLLGLLLISAHMSWQIANASLTILLLLTISSTDKFSTWAKQWTYRAFGFSWNSRKLVNDWYYYHGVCNFLVQHKFS